MEKKIYLVSLIFLLTVAAAPRSEEKFITKRVQLTVPDDIEKFKSEVASNVQARNGRISNGLPATDTQFPFIAEVTVQWRDASATKCTASLVATNYVLTSRSCIVNDSINQVGSVFMAEFGSASRTGARTAAFGVWAIWQNGVNGNPSPDFSLFRLGVNLTLSATINTIQLPRITQIEERFQMAAVVIAGWGDLDVAGTPASTLQWADFINTTPFECTPDTVLGVNEFHICSTPATPTTVLRTGDFGAPVILFENGPTMPPTLIGVTSTSGFSVLTFSDVAVSTQIGQFLEFIVETTGISWRF